MSSSLIPACTDALVTLLTAALPTLPVVDGGVIGNEERAALLVGSGLANSDFPWQQRWAGLGHAARDETFEIPCTLWVRDGGNVLKPIRDEAFGYLATVEASLRATPTLGVATNSIRAQILPANYAQPQTPDGVVCRLDFYVNVEGRI